MIRLNERPALGLTKPSGIASNINSTDMKGNPMRQTNSPIFLLFASVNNSIVVIDRVDISDTVTSPFGAI